MISGDNASCAIDYAESFYEWKETPRARKNVAIAVFEKCANEILGLNEVESRLSSLGVSSFDVYAG
jgi:hypothetical protein